MEDEDEVRCIHCGDWADDYYAPDLWTIPYSEFASVHSEEVSDPDWFGPPPGDPDAELSGCISGRKTCLHICPTCGWWVAEDRTILPAVGGQKWVVTLASMSVFQEMDLSDINAPLEEVRRYLSRKFEDRMTMHPRLFELTVTSVFSDIGCRAIATAYSNDGGIDAVLETSDGHQVGVQIKRRRNTIEVEQIRAFLGALTLEGYTRGVFVSSSRFSRGAICAAERSSANHIPIALVDADRFFDMLRYAQLGNAPGPEECGISGDKPLKFHCHSYYYLNSL